MGTSLTLQIDDMSCGHCVKAVTEALASVPGVKTQEVAVGSARIEATDAAAVALAVSAVGEAGFTAHITPITGISKQPGCCGGKGDGCC
jgi:copper chaperone